MLSKDDLYGRRVALACVCVYACVRIAAARLHPFLVDDAYITARYAANLVAGKGLVFNPGQRVFGITTILYPLLIAASSLVAQIDAAVAIRIVNVCADIALFLAGARVLRRAGVRPVLAMPLCLATSAGVSLLVASQGGMETPLFCLALISTALLMETATASAAAFAGVATLLRPEGVLFLAITSWQSLRRRKWIGIGIAILGGLAFVGFLWIDYGTIVPASVRVKSGMSPSDRRAAATALTYAVGSILGNLPLLVSLPAVLGISALGIRAWATESKATLWGLIGFSTLYFFLYTLANPPMWFWYGAPLAVAVSFPFARGLAALFEKAAPRAATPIAVAVCAALFAYHARSAFFVQHGLLGLYEDRIGGYQSAVGKLRSTAGLLPSDVILTHEIGAVGYFSQARICDAVGLVNPDLASLSREALHPGERPTAGAITAELVRACKPRFILAQQALFAPSFFASEAGDFEELFRMPNTSISATTGDLIVYRHKGATW